MQYIKNHTSILITIIMFYNKASIAQVRYYDFVRYNDRNFSYLKNDTLDKDFFNGIKYIPFNKSGKSFLTLGGEIRENYQWIKNENWGDLPPTWKDNNGFLWHRAMVHANVKLGNKVRIFSQLKHTSVLSRAGGARPVLDKDDLSVHQAFIDYTFQHNKEQFTIRAGRQEHNFGWGKLVSIREGPNNRQTFDGLTVIHENKKWNNRLFFANDVSVEDGVFDNNRVKDQYIYGLFSTYKIPSKQPVQIESYYIGSNRPNMFLANKTGTDKRHTVGMGLSTFKTGFLYEIEGIYQFGKLGNTPISAYSIVGMLGYEWGLLRLKPTLKLYGGMSSGDKASSSKHNTYNPLYPRPPYILALAFGVSNVNGAQLEFSIRPKMPMKIALGSFLIRRNTADDGIYTPGIVLIRPIQWQANLATLSKNVANYHYAEFEYFTGRHWQLNFQAAILPPGTFVKQTGQGSTTYYVMAQTTFRF
jgi:hypothetical protein